MSSSKRGREFQNRWGLSTLVPAKKKKHSKSEQIAYLNRIIKRANKAAGYSSGKFLKIWNYFHTYGADWNQTGRGGTVEGHTKSDARCEVKKILEIPANKPIPGLLKLELKHDPNK